MLYFAYCRMCNYLVANIEEKEAKQLISKHQVKSHNKVSHKDIITFCDKDMTFSDWLGNKKSRYYWFVWKYRHKPEAIRRFDEALKMMFPTKRFSLSSYAEKVA